jgi:hypothetical protein
MAGRPGAWLDGNVMPGFVTCVMKLSQRMRIIALGDQSFNSAERKQS